MKGLIPYATVVITRYLIPAHNGVPNTSLAPHPLMVYRSIFDPSCSPSDIRAQLDSVRVVKPAWEYPMYSQHHYHSTTHEVLVICAGRARLFFGGEGNPQGIRIEVRKGDALVIPAGVGHALEEDLEGGFRMIGSYPIGSEQWDHQTGDCGAKGKARIKRLGEPGGWIKGDPFYGDLGTWR